jgi:hypothetical protein
MFTQTDGGRSEAGFVEKNDCTVRAIAATAGMTYLQAHELLKHFGRRDKRKFKFVNWICSVRNINGHVPVPVTVSIGAKTTGTFLKMKLSGRFIVRTKGHVFAVIDGVIHDDGRFIPRARVRNIWRMQ